MASSKLESMVDQLNQYNGTLNSDQIGKYVLTWTTPVHHRSYSLEKITNETGGTFVVQSGLVYQEMLVFLRGALMGWVAATVHHQPRIMTPPPRLLIVGLPEDKPNNEVGLREQLMKQLTADIAQMSYNIEEIEHDE